ncbi:MAG: hypothetical protein JRF63_01045 [Deltaproteobacteria bacterium]|nr:hypothetical protein [Deltaproteobacteria bacterium]
MPTRFMPVTAYSITHHSGLTSSVRAEVSLFDNTSGVALVATLRFFDRGADPAAAGSAEGPSGDYPLEALAAMIDTLRNEKPIMACLDVDSDVILYVGTQQLEPAGEGQER